jgi:hypothetical protein
MPAIFKDLNVRSPCPDCDGAVTTFELKDATRGEHETIIVDGQHTYKGQSFNRVLYMLLRCAGCHRAGLAKVHDNGHVTDGVMEWFFPAPMDRAQLPSAVPAGIQAEYREAELCASVGAWRAASGLLRSTLEKTLKDNGYTKGTLEAKIDQAAGDGIITESRRKRAHEDIRVLGNDVLHDEWREVTEEEYSLAHHYLQRVLEDFYDDRPAVLAILAAKKGNTVKGEV